MQFAGGDQRGHAAMHVVGDPRQRILRRRVLADRRMRMRIDQTGNRGDAVGVDGLIGGLIQTVADRLNNTVFNEDRIRLPERTFQFTRDQACRCF